MNSDAIASAISCSAAVAGRPRPAMSDVAHVWMAAASSLAISSWRRLRLIGKTTQYSDNHHIAQQIEEPFREFTGPDLGAPPPQVLARDSL
jgi:hypothetical protein